MVIYGASLSAIINKSFEDVFVYLVLLKLILKYLFYSFEFFFFVAYSNSIRHRIANVAFTSLQLPPTPPHPIATKGRYKSRNELVDGSL